MLFQDTSTPSVGNDTKSYVGSLSFFHLTTVKTSHLSTMNLHNSRSYSICNQGFQKDQNLQMHKDFSDAISSPNFQTSAKLHNKKKVGSGASHGSSSSSSSLRSLDHFFSLKDSTSSSSLSPSGFFGSIFPPVPSTGVGKERRQDFGDQASMYGSPSFSDNKGENKTSKASNMYQNEAVDPCNLSSSIYYGSQENYSPRIGTTESHQHHTSKKDGSKDDANSASRGNWWQGSLYY
ncbi:hypothetical protein DVH24_022979 [Malus domestica]|uniref:Uncharacterized protein n=1 Tax=Malus domestica TaxID=3750 RepID=A0A498KSZ5_MALDO|nr:hypothetical protein DVH24_022979 [Malus domestica]